MSDEEMIGQTRKASRRWIWAWAVSAILVGIFVGLLVLEGRPGWCKFGLAFWTGAWTHCTSQNFLDPYSFSHLLHGIIFYWALRWMWPRMELRWQLVGALLLEIGWELLENSAWVIERYRQQTASLDYVGDSIINSVGDVLSTAAGFGLASRMSWKGAVAVYVVVEIVLLVTIRDNLTLNVLMLFWPLEWVKEWQMGMGG
jgi:hypothetical protein